MDGPYRDLGAGFARLMGAEGARRAPNLVRSVEDALLELLKNARDAGARNIYVASVLRDRRYRSLTVLDDGHGIPATHQHLVFEPGVTTRHLMPPSPSPAIRENGESTARTASAGLSLHHIKRAALSAEVLSHGRPAPGSPPTSLQAVFDTTKVPERSLQSRPSKSNLPATTAAFANAHPNISLYHDSPTRILALLLQNHIIHNSGYEGAGVQGVMELGNALGLEVSSRTVRRVVGGSILAAGRVVGGAEVVGRAEVEEGAERSAAGAFAGGARGGRSSGARGPILRVGSGYLESIRGVLRSAAGASYVEIAGLEVEECPGEVVIRVRVVEPEEEYE